MPIWVIQTSVAILATFFTLVMSNVGATVLLVPLAVNIAIGAGANPAVFALTVAIATSNSFLIPTHQVNALIMGPAGYRVPDYESRWYYDHTIPGRHDRDDEPGLLIRRRGWSLGPQSQDCGFFLPRICSAKLFETIFYSRSLILVGGDRV